MICFLFRESCDIAGYMMKDKFGGSNGNGITPPDTPKRSQSPRAGHSSPKHLSGSSSPVVIPPRPNLPQESTNTSPQPRSIGISPLASQESSVRRSSNQSDTSALVSSITRDLSQSTSQKIDSSFCEIKSETSKDESEQNGVKLTQTGTQTSPENVTIKGHFSIGTTNKEERVSPKSVRKERSVGKVRPKRAISPANLQQLPSSSKVIYPGSEPVKPAISPSVAESLRAVFAAFLWHEGVVHDAMACASFLKFHPTLPKQGALVVTRHPECPIDKRRQELTKEEKQRQRHSVEVSNAGNYLHIQPSTLESLTRSAANASANRNRSRKLTDGAIREEGSDGFGYQTISVLPPALKSLVYLWEELTCNCLQAITQQMIIASPINKKIQKCDKIMLNAKNDLKDKTTVMAAERDGKKSRKKKIPPRNYLEDIGLSSFHSPNAETLCELCGDNFPHPVTYHMHQTHPGCGQHSGGKGYNSGGNYCLGWAGNCGDGGIRKWVELSDFLLLICFFLLISWKFVVFTVRKLPREVCQVESRRQTNQFEVQTDEEECLQCETVTVSDTFEYN